jgi:hypothetical protein
VRRLGKVVIVALLTSAIYLPTVAQQTAQAACGGFRWPVKTLSDPDRHQVDFDPIGTQVKFLRLRDLPAVSIGTSTPRTALTSGTLIEQHGCVFLMPGDVLLIWPNDATADRTTGGALRVMVGGKLVGQTGDELQLGGGFVGESKDAVKQAEDLMASRSRRDAMPQAATG